jgi:3-deoxy-D-manno-octulosonate 8-phosphate phosphatase (KDO 8-P phosphatase)
MASYYKWEYMTTSGKNLFERAAAIRLVVMDVDGVLTDGKIIYTSDGQELKDFNVKDGLGISLARRAGIELGIITARESAMLLRRAAELDIQHIAQKTKTKLPAFEQLASSLGLTFEQVAYIGDDLPDIPCMERAGLSACPADAAWEVRQAAALVSNHKGGGGAVREILEFILDSQRLLNSMHS